jgi:class 3 adenylate cyclase
MFQLALARFFKFVISQEEAMERKLTAIVAADVVNYSALIGQDEIGTLTTLDRLQDEVIVPAIKQHGGRIVRLMGDGSILAFNSALNAVQFAVDVQRAMSKRKTIAPHNLKIDFRMGANLGDIIHTKNDIHGEGINIAVRLEELAPPGGICLSNNIYSQTKNVLNEVLLPIGERQLKNIAEPVLVWRWQPPEAHNADRSGGYVRRPPRHAHGRHILDPKVTSILIDLHTRSAKLALSDAFDSMLLRPDRGRNLSLKQIHKVIGRQMSIARKLVFPISVELYDGSKPKAKHDLESAKGLSEILDGSQNSEDMFFNLTMLKRTQSILRSTSSDPQKRAAFMRLTQDFLREPKVARIKESIRFAFIDP